MPALQKTPTMRCADNLARDALTLATANDRQSAAALLEHTRAAEGWCQIAPSDAIATLLASAYQHDRATCDHAARMVHLAEAVATQLGRPAEERPGIRLATLLHDIGKLAIPAAIRHKPGPLTTAEWLVMRRHPEIGQQMLQQMDSSLDHIGRIVVAHHERWDGLGYPHGLAREAILLSARIIAVVDSFDAMISHRPYCAPLTIAAARAELLRGAGSQFDPVIVGTFLAMGVDGDANGGA